MTIDEYIKEYGSEMTSLSGLGYMPEWEKQFLLGRRAIRDIGNDSWAITSQLQSIERGKEVVEEYLPTNYVRAKEELETWKKQKDELKKMGISEIEVDDLEDLFNK